MASIDQEAREHIILITGLLDHFGCRTKQQEELLWARAKEAATGNQVAHLVESLDQRISQLEQRVMNLEIKATTIAMWINNEQVYVDKNLNEIEQILIGLTRRMKIVEEITKNLNRT